MTSKRHQHFRTRAERAAAERALLSDKNYEAWRRDLLCKGFSELDIAKLAHEAAQPAVKVERKKLPPKRRRQSSAPRGPSPRQELDREFNEMMMDGARWKTTGGVTGSLNHLFRPAETK